MNLTYPNFDKHYFEIENNRFIYQRCYILKLSTNTILVNLFQNFAKKVIHI